MRDQRTAGRVAARLWAPALVALVAVAVRAGTIAYDLVWDDALLLRDLQASLQQGGLLAVITTKFVVAKATYFRPVVMFSLWTDTMLSGVIPVSYHLTNILLHAANAVLVYVLGSRLLRSNAAAVIGALLFAVHPVHTESVVFVSGRTDLFATFFVLLAVLCWARLRSGGETDRLAATAIGAAALFLGAFSKETAFLVPAFLLVWSLVDPERPRDLGTWWRRNKTWLIVWPGTLLVAFLLRSAALSGAASPWLSGQPAAPALSNLRALVETWLLYLRLLVIPWPLNTYYTEYHTGLTALTILGVAIFGAVVWIANRAQPRFGLFVAGWVGCFLLPVSGIVPLNAAVLAERYLYLPSVAACLALGVVLRRARDLPALRPAIYPAALAVGVALAAGSVAQNAVWRNDETLFRTMVRTSPQASIGHRNLASTLRLQERYSEAIPFFRNALAIERGSAELHNDLGCALAEVGLTAEAITNFLAAIKLDPASYESHYNLADLYDQAGQPQAALKHYLEVLRYDPGNQYARQRAEALLREGPAADPKP